VSGTPLIDLDVHNELRNHQRDLFPYLASGWQDFVSAGHFEDPQRGMSVVPGVSMFGMQPGGYERKDSVPEDGSFAGSDPAVVIEQLLDPFGIEYAILTGGFIPMTVSGFSNVHFAQEVARAQNDELVDTWLERDPRFRGSITFSIQVPEWGAEEIRRWADDDRMVQTISACNPLPYPFGHPIFDPVHRACAETGRPFAIHSLGDCAVNSGPTALAAGQPTFYVEYHSGADQALITHMMSFIYNGVFERYPDLRLVLLECGVGWIPSVVTRMDTEWKSLRREVPWCKRPPSEYFAEKVTVSTQPFDIRSDDEPWFEWMDRLGLKGSVAFSSDYPHWDTDTPTRIQGILPPSWREDVSYGNASKLYQLPVSVR
jgi:uncharacterized protein